MNPLKNLAKLKSEINSKFSGGIDNVTNKIAKGSKSDFPTAISSKITALLLAGVGIILAGIVAACFYRHDVLYILGVPVLCALCIGGYVLDFKYQVKTRGCDIIEGKCELQYKATLLSPISKKIKGYGIKCGEEMLYLPVSKRAFEIPVGCSVLVYAPKNPRRRKDSNGIIHLDTIWHYEIK